MKNKIYLEVKDKERIRQNLVAFMRENPVMLEKPKSIKSPFFIWYRPVISASFAFVFLIFFGTVFASSYSLPGDLLYPIKINVKERAEAMLATNDESLARVSLEHTENRLKEVEFLATLGKLTPEVAIQNQEKIGRETENINLKIEKLHEEGDSDKALALNADLEDSLAVHEEVINKISNIDKNKDSKELLKNLVVSVGVKNVNTDVNINNSSNVNVKVSATTAPENARIATTMTFATSVSVSTSSESSPDSSGTSSINSELSKKAASNTDNSRSDIQNQKQRALNSYLDTEKRLEKRKKAILKLEAELNLNN